MTASLRAEQVRAVGAGFLRKRPFIVAPIAAVNVVGLSMSGAPSAQRLAIGGAIGTTLGLFVVEAWMVRRVPVSERWFVTSLALTLAMLGTGCLLSGGLSSPLVALLLAPLVVGIAAFGRGRGTVVLLAIAATVAAAAFYLPAVFPPIEPGAARVMTLAALLGSAALSFVGVGGLVEAHAHTAEDLQRVTAATLEEAASRMRDTEQLGAKVAHELKNPLAAVRALVQLLGRIPDEKTRERMSVALTEIDRMDEIVRDYLAFNRPLASHTPEPTDLAQLARDVVLVLEARAERAGTHIVASGERAILNGDPRRLREAVLNLASNALAVTPRGGTVSLTVRSESDAVRVDVEDEGPGLPPEVATGEKPFTTNTDGGTGLGLVIARAAITHHDGTLAFAKRTPRGTLATIRIPRGGTKS